MAEKVENITPYGGDRHKSEQVKEMFDSIAPAYDFMNRAMTLGIDRHWRAKAVKMIARDHPRDILDVATGTGDLAIELARSLSPRSVTGIDLSEGMVARGRAKIQAEGLSHVVRLEVADCLALPMEDNTYDCVTVAYGVRNFERLQQGYREMLRVLRPGGVICVIELSTPTSPVVKPLYKLYTRGVIPLVGRLVSRDRRAYSYLPQSIEAVAQGSEMAALMAEAGFTECAYRPLTFGVCTIYTGRKPS